MFDFDWETILLVFMIIGYLNDMFDLVDHIIDLAKAIIRGIKWIIDRIRTARKKVSRLLATDCAHFRYRRKFPASCV